MTEVYTLQPGVDQTRPDWSPIAQPEDRHGVIAHTPNPSGYHNIGGRTMLPRASGEFGASRGFDTRPGVLNIDPTDPVRGTGGITVDLERVSKRGYKQAAEAAQGNPVAAWHYAAQLQVAEAPQPPPVQQQPMVQQPMYPQPAQGGMMLQPPQQMQPYVTPHTTPSGGVSTWNNGSVNINQPMQAPSPLMGMGGAFPQPAQIQATISPATKPRRGSQMPAPQEVEPWAQTPMQVAPGPSPVLQGDGGQSMPQYPQQAPQQAPPQPQGAQQPYYPQQQQPYYPQQPPTQNGYPAPNSPMPQPPPAPPAPPVQADPTQAMMLQLLTKIADRLEPKDQDVRVAEDPRRDPRAAGSWQSRFEQPQPEPEPQLQHMRASMEDTGLAFLTDPPSKPGIQVIFDLGMGGMHSKRFHHVSKRGVCLSLVYDARYDGDQFIPPNTPEGETIGIRIPSQNIDVRAMVFDYHQNIGCLDILNFIIWGGDHRAQGPPIMTPDTASEIHSLVGAGAY